MLIYNHSKGHGLLDDPSLPGWSGTHEVFILGGFYVSCVGGLVLCLSPQIVILFWEVVEMLGDEGKLEVRGHRSGAVVGCVYL